MHTPRLSLVRALAVAAAVALTVAACAPDQGIGAGADGSDHTATPDVGDGPVPPGGAPTTPADAPGANDATADPPPEGGVAASPAPAAALTPVDDRGPVGANGPAILRGDRPQLVVEVDVQEGASPTPAALDHLVATLAEHADKPGGVALAGGNTFRSDRDRWTVDDLRDVSAAHRSTRSDDDTVSVYVLYVRGGFEEGGDVTTAIGAAHRASEFAVFPDRWRGLGDLVGAGAQVERAVLVHELGHLLGLVELTYTSEHPRQDPEHPGHSANRGSVMHWAVETTLVDQVFNGPPPDRFDAADVADLVLLRERR